MLPTRRHAAGAGSYAPAHVCQRNRAFPACVRSEHVLPSAPVEAGRPGDAPGFFPASTEQAMPLPPGYQMVTAASAGPGAPFTGVQCPDDGQKAAAADIRRVAATMLANDNYYNGIIDGIIAAASVTTTYQTALATRATGAGSLESFSTIGYTASGYAYVDIASVAVGDKIDASLVFDVETNSPPGDFLLRLVTVEDYGGAGTVTAIPGAAWVTQAGPGRNRAVLQGITTISTAGPLRVRLEVSGPTAGLDLMYNYGTGSLIVRRTHVGA